MAEIGHMRARLGEMRRLSAAAEAPTKLEGFLMDAAKVYNEDLGLTGAGWVRHRCIELLSEGGKRVPDALRHHVLTLQELLETADEGERQWSNGTERDAEALKTMQRNNVSRLPPV